MYLSYFALGALVGVLFRDRRALSSIVPATAVLIYIGLRDHEFGDWWGGLGWFFGHVACFQIGLVLSGIAISFLCRLVDAGRDRSQGRSTASRVN